MKLQQSTVNLIADALFAKSRTKANYFINKATGYFHDQKDFFTVMSFNLCEYDEGDILKHSMIRDTINDLQPLSSLEAELLNEIHPNWILLTSIFEDKFGYEVIFHEIFGEYKKIIQKCSLYEFNEKLVTWAKECGYKINIKKMFSSRTIIVLK